MSVASIRRRWRFVPRIQRKHINGVDELEFQKNNEFLFKFFFFEKPLQIPISFVASRRPKFVIWSGVCCIDLNSNIGFFNFWQTRTPDKTRKTKKRKEAQAKNGVQIF
ncbi:hypothetical protein [Methanimicrococcus hacksteinii]|uniref:hypothetical protein n=1 Tax=Methanimicrococcus hacksteinii TaxID=3028293 RepID=UPI00298ED12F|nr:hypothetical protein [Methanimicrococcus sp. At1]